MDIRETGSTDVDLAVVGGGLAGLSAAALVAQTGQSVILFEQASDVGGRGATQVRQGIYFNLGPHALYCLGQAFRLMRDLEIPFTGNVPSPGKSRLLTSGGRDHPLPRGLIQMATGEVVRSGTAVVAVAPKTACDLLQLPPDAPLARWTANSMPVRAACLDVALKRLDRPRQRFALGLDRPFYYSVHSAAAKLAPEGTSVVHVMKYLRDESSVQTDAIETELEGCLDRLQPGWRSHTIARRYLPNMTVAHSLPLAREDGLAGQPAVSLAEHPNVFLAGDWVGPEALLADAAAASARSSARHVLAALAQTGAETMRESLHVAS